MTQYQTANEYTLAQSQNFGDGLTSKTSRRHIRQLAQDTADTFNLRSAGIGTANKIGQTGNLSYASAGLSSSNIFSLRSIIGGRIKATAGGVAAGAAVFKITANPNIAGHDIPLGILQMRLIGDNCQFAVIDFGICIRGGGIDIAYAVSNSGTRDGTKNIYYTVSRNRISNNFYVASSYASATSGEANNFQLGYGFTLIGGVSDFITSIDVFGPTDSAFTVNAQQLQTLGNLTRIRDWLPVTR